MQENQRQLEAGIRKRTSNSNKGQATVEFALVLFVLVTILYGVLEVSRLVFVNSELDNGAREAAQYISINPPGTTRYDANTLRTAVLSKMTLVNPSDVTITTQADRICDFCPITATVSYRWTTLVPILKLGPVDLHSSSVKLIENSR